MADASGWNDKVCMQLAEAAERERMVDMDDHTAQMIGSCKAIPPPPLPEKRPEHAIMPDFSDADIEKAVARFVQLRKLPCSCAIPVQDIGEGEYGGARLRPLHNICLILQGAPMFARDVGGPRDMFGLVSRIKRAIVAFNSRLDDAESGFDNSAGDTDSGSKPLLDEHLADGVQEFVRIHEFPSSQQVR